MASDRMETERLGVHETERAAEILRAGGLVAFPTETVYGLGANAWDAAAIQKIFIAKDRPADNPLIVHLADCDQLETVGRAIPSIAYDLFERWAPGPLTLVIPKHVKLPSIVSAGLDSVAVRIPQHPVAHELLRRCGLPIAAPSANRSGRPSATNWQAVWDDLAGRIDAVLCGDATLHGLESTVVDLTGQTPVLLRAGAVTVEQLRESLPDLQLLHSETDPAKSPGMRHRHYQPTAMVRLCRSPDEIDLSLSPRRGDERIAYIGLMPWENSPKGAVCLQCRDLDEYGARLFDFFRTMDRQGITAIWCQEVAEEGIGRAIMDRLRRAAAPKGK